MNPCMDCGKPATVPYFGRCRCCLWKLRMFLFRSQGRRCDICAGQLIFQRWNLDHIIPTSRGGGNREDNLQLVHSACNYWRDNELVRRKT